MGEKVVIGEEFGPTTYFKPKEAEANTVIVENAVYDGSRDGQFGKTHYFKLADGSSVGVGEFGKLRALLQAGNVEPGTPIEKLTYLGQTPIAKGQWAGKMAHDVELIKG